VLLDSKQAKYHTYEDFPVEELLTYAGIDCIATSGVLAKTWSMINAEPIYTRYKRGKPIEEKLLSIAESMERYTMPAYEFICDMEINGIKYDVVKNRYFANRMEIEVGELEAKIEKAIGKKIDLDSGKVLAEFLYKEKGLEAPYLTQHGEPSTDGDALKELAKSNNLEWLGWIGKRNDIVSVYRTFIRDYATEHVKRDGRIHPSYNQFGTSSFRISGDKPNLTQLPRPKHGYNIRECFTVEDGNVFIAFDFSSAEVKVLGALSGDPNLVRAIREGRDFHSFSASAMHNIPYDKFIEILADEKNPNYRKYKEMRQQAKTLTFSILYGSTPQGVARQLNIDVEFAEQLIAMYFNAYPLIKVFIEDAHAMALANHYVVSPFAQRKWEFGTRKEFKYTAAFNACKRNAQNVLIQNTTSSLGLFSFMKLNEAVKSIGGKSLCTVYDSIELEIPKAKAAEAIELGFKYMDDFPVQAFDWLDFPIGCDGEIGINWGELHKVHRGITQKEVEGILDGN
jgi:DNA polymerase-1